MSTSLVILPPKIVSEKVRDDSYITPYIPVVNSFNRDLLSNICLPSTYTLHFDYIKHELVDPETGLYSIYFTCSDLNGFLNLLDFCSGSCGLNTVDECKFEVGLCYYDDIEAMQNHFKEHIGCFSCKVGSLACMDESGKVFGYTSFTAPSRCSSNCPSVCGQSVKSVSSFATAISSNSSNQSLSTNASILKRASFKLYYNTEQRNVYSSYADAKNLRNPTNNVCPRGLVICAAVGNKNTNIFKVHCEHKFSVVGYISAHPKSLHIQKGLAIYVSDVPLSVTQKQVEAKMKQCFNTHKVTVRHEGERRNDLHKVVSKYFTVSLMNVKKSTFEKAMSKKIVLGSLLCTMQISNATQKLKELTTASQFDKHCYRKSQRGVAVKQPKKVKPVKKAVKLDNQEEFPTL